MKRIQVVAGIIVRKNSSGTNEILIAKRHASQHQGGLWEFPGGKIEPNELPQTALYRELKEEINIEINSSQLFEKIEFDYTDKNVSLLFYLINSFSGFAKGNEGQPIAWVNQHKLNEYQFPQANQPIVDRLASFKFD